MTTSKQHLPEFSRLLDIIKRLRDPENGCPWDLKQTHQTLLKYLLEESYEFIHAVENEPLEMEGEIGDILLQVLLHSQIASETNQFDIESVSKNLADKMIRRHPHIFSDNLSAYTQADLTDEALQKNWDRIKKEETSHKLLKKQDLLSSSSFHGPALAVSSKIGKKTKAYKFDWKKIQDVEAKVEEEWQEVKQELAVHLNPSDNSKRVQEEIGDLLFSIAQLCRHMSLDPEQTLRMANQKFLKRFNSMNELIKSDNTDINELEQSELEDYWKRVKSHESQS